MSRLVVHTFAFQKVCGFCSGIYKPQSRRKSQSKIAKSQTAR